MNDMSTPVVAAQEMAGTPASFGLDDAHRLRSKIIGKCAAVESWLVDQISSVQKPEMMFSKKIEQLEKLSEQGKIDYKQPDKLNARLYAFKPFADFRSEIVHSEMVVMTCDGKITVFFENAAQTCEKMLRKQIVISIDELNEVWLNMSTAANVLTSP